MAENGKKKARKASGPIITNADFITKWEAANTIVEAKAALGVAAGARAKRMRDAGVPLKEFPSNRSKLDVAALAAMIGRPALTPKPKKPKKAKSDVPSDIQG